MTLPPNPAPPNPVPNQTVIPPLQATQFSPNTTAFSQYGTPSSSSANLFLGPALFPFQSGYQFPQFGFPMVANQYPSPISAYNGFAMPNYHHPQPIHHPYENVQPAGYPPVSWQPPIPSHPPPPTFNTNRSISGPQHFRSPSPTFGPSSAGDPLEFPELKDWLERIDRDSVRSRWGHQFSQLSARFELDGLTSILDLEGMPVNTLVHGTGIHEEAAQRLLRFVHEDITEIRASRPSPAKRMRYSR